MAAYGLKYEELKPRVKSLGKFVAVLVSSWICVAVGFIAILSPIISIGGAIYYWSSRRRVAALVLLLVTPITIAFLGGTASYFCGTAKLQYIGYPGPEFFNLDPDLRCGRTTSGCIVHGGEWAYQTPNNLAVWMMTSIFGWMPGTYTGSYPSLDECRDALRKGSQVPLKELQRGRIPIDGTEIVLTSGVRDKLLFNHNYPHQFAGQTVPPLMAAVWKNDCVVLRTPMQSPWKYEDVAGVIYLIDRQAGESFAMYIDEHGPQR